MDHTVDYGDSSQDAAAQARRSSLSTMREHFFGERQQVEPMQPPASNAEDEPQQQQQHPQPFHAGALDGSGTDSLPPTATASFGRDAGSSSSGVGMSAARKYFFTSSGPEADEQHANAATAGLPVAPPLFGAQPASPVSQHSSREQQEEQSSTDHKDNYDDDQGDEEPSSYAVVTSSAGAGAADSGNDDVAPWQPSHVTPFVLDAREEEKRLLATQASPRHLTDDEEQQLRMQSYDTVSGKSTLDFWKETTNAVLPGALAGPTDDDADIVDDRQPHRSRSGFRGAATTTTNAIGTAATRFGHVVEMVPGLMVRAIPEQMMSSATKKMLFGDFANTLRSFFHTNILSMPFVFNQAGLLGGLFMLSLVAFTSEYATEAFFGAKNQLAAADRVVVYGDVPRFTWGDWYPTINIFYGITHLIGFIAFCTSNSRVLLAAMGLTGSGATAVSLIVPSILALPLVFIKRDVNQKPYAIISSILVLVSVILMWTYFPFSAAAGVKLWANSASDFFVALGVTVYAFTGLGSCAPIERTMRPRRYVMCLRVAVSCTYAVLLAFGLSGFLSYGSSTCSVITVSLQHGGMKTVVSALLFVASLAIIPQQTFPLCELCDRRLLGIRHVPTYWELKPNILRVVTLTVSIIAAWTVPYYGLLLSISGALGCGIVGIIVPAALDYVRRARWGLREGRHLKTWEYFVVFGLGLYGCFVVVIGVTFGMYKMWITIQTSAVDTC